MKKILKGSYFYWFVKGFKLIRGKINYAIIAEVPRRAVRLGVRNP